MKLTERVYLVGSGLSDLSLTHALDCNVYLLDGGGELALIDAGVGLEWERILALVRRDGFDPARIGHVILTHQHGDHAGGAYALRQATGARVYLSAAAARYLREGDEAGISLPLGKRAGLYPQDYRYQACPVDVELREGDTIAVGDVQLHVLDTPGHCEGHQSFVLSVAERRYLFAGDAVFSGGQVLIQCIPDCHVATYAHSIEKLRGRDIDTLLAGHLAPIMTAGQTHIDLAADAFARGAIPRNII